MTFPGAGGAAFGGLGAAYVWIRAYTDRMQDDVKKGLEQVAKDSDKTTKKAGEALGESLTDHMVGEIESQSFSRRLGAAVSRSIKRQRLNLDFDFDRNSIQRAGMRVGGALVAGISKGFKAGGGAVSGIVKGIGGVLGPITKSLGSSVGNVGSNGPLAGIFGIAILTGIPALIAAIASLLAVFYPLVNVVLLLPGALGVLVAALGPTIIAFSSLGDAVSAVMEAGNDPRKLAKAYEQFGVSQVKVAQSIAKAIPWWKDLARFTQEAFFAPIARVNAIERFMKSLGPTLFLGFERVADASGRFFASLILLAEDPRIRSFLDGLFRTTANVFDLVKPGLDRFIIGLAQLGLVSLPALETGAFRLGQILQRFGEWLGEISANGQFNSFMETLSTAWLNLKALADSGWSLVKAIVGSAEEEDKAQAFLNSLITAIDILTGFFESELGKKSMQGLIVLAEIFLGLLVSIVIAWTGIGLLVQAVVEFVKFLIRVVKDLYGWLDRAVSKSNTLRGIVLSTVPLYGVLEKLGGAPMALGGIVTNPTMALIGEAGTEVVIPLTNRQRAQELAEVSGLANMLGNSSGGNGTNIVFGPNSIQINFGGIPSESEAYRAGTAVRRGISDQLALRDTRLAVRTL